jgi:DNA-binding transcriptional LysR family regulator
MINLPDLNRIKVFYVVYVNRSLVKAAQSLNISRSAISQSLKALETELGLKLFIRNSKNILPTDSAERLFQSVEPLISDLSATIHQLETGRKNSVGHLRIGAPQDFGSTLLTEAIVDFRKVNPLITFELVLAIPTNLLELVSSSKLDMAFVDNGDIHAGKYPVSIVTVMKEKFVMACSREYFQEHVRQAKPKFEDLKKLDFVDYLSHAPVAKMWIKHQLGKTVLDLNVVFTAESVRAVVRALQGGMGVGIVPEKFIEQDLKTGRLRLLYDGERDFINKISLAKRLERPSSAREREFVDFYKKRVGL